MRHRSLPPKTHPTSAIHFRLKSRQGLDSERPTMKALFHSCDFLSFFLEQPIWTDHVFSGCQTPLRLFPKHATLQTLLRSLGAASYAMEMAKAFELHRSEE